MESMLVVTRAPAAPFGLRDMLIDVATAARRLLRVERASV